MGRSTHQPERDQLDPVVVHARREAVVILAAFAACLIWSVGYCYLAGYHEPARPPIRWDMEMPHRWDGGTCKCPTDGMALSTLLGMPSWVFWGVLVPWLAADLFACWFCFFFMADDPLGESQDEREPGNGTTDCRHRSRRGRA